MNHILIINIIQLFPQRNTNSTCCSVCLKDCTSSLYRKTKLVNNHSVDAHYCTQSIQSTTIAENVIVN